MQLESLSPQSLHRYAMCSPVHTVLQRAAVDCAESSKKTSAGVLLSLPSNSRGSASEGNAMRRSHSANHSFSSSAAGQESMSSPTVQVAISQLRARRYE